MTQEIVLTDLRDLAHVIDRFPVDDRVPESMALVAVVDGNLTRRLNFGVNGR